MGVYIPGGSSGSSKGDDDDKSKKSSFFPSNNSFTFHYRPNVGLKIWGPLVPASDFLPGLYSLTAMQAIVGLVMFKHVRNIWHVKTAFGRFSKFLNAFAGSYLIFNSGLEVSRLILPYDPWYDEAKAARATAKAAGQHVNFWFGPWDFKPMSFRQWSEKVDEWVLHQEAQLEHAEQNPNLQKSFSVANKEFHAVHMKLRELNKQRNSQILKQLQDSDSFKEILPNYQNFANIEFDRPPVTLPQENNLEDDLDFLQAWEMNDPWTALGQDTVYVVRFIPKFRWIEKIEENKKLIQEAEKRVQQEQEKQFKALENELDLEKSA